MRPDARDRAFHLLALTLPMVLSPFGLLAWIVTLLAGIRLGDELPGLGLAVVLFAWTLPTSVRLLSLSVQGRWVVAVATLSLPVGVLGGLASMFTMVFWDAGLLSGPPPADRAFRAMTLGYLSMAAPVAIGQAAVEAFGVGFATRWRTGAGSVAVSMGLAWVLSSTLVVAGFAWDAQAGAPWAPWAACDLALVLTFFGPVPGAVVGRALARLFGRTIAPGPPRAGSVT